MTTDFKVGDVVERVRSGKPWYRARVREVTTRGRVPYLLVTVTDPLGGRDWLAGANTGSRAKAYRLIERKPSTLEVGKTYRFVYKDTNEVSLAGRGTEFTATVCQGPTWDPSMVCIDVVDPGEAGRVGKTADLDLYSIIEEVEVADDPRADPVGTIRRDPEGGATAVKVRADGVNDPWMKLDSPEEPGRWGWLRHQTVQGWVKREPAKTEFDAELEKRFYEAGYALGQAAGEQLKNLQAAKLCGQLIEYAAQLDSLEEQAQATAGDWLALKQECEQKDRRIVELEQDVFGYAGTVRALEHKMNQQKKPKVKYYTDGGLYPWYWRQRPGAGFEVNYGSDRTGWGPSGYADGASLLQNDHEVRSVKAKDVPENIRNA